MSVRLDTRGDAHQHRRRFQPFPVQRLQPVDLIERIDHDSADARASTTFVEMLGRAIQISACAPLALPGDALTVSMWVDGGQCLFQTKNQDGDVVLDQGEFTFA